MLEIMLITDNLFNDYYIKSVTTASHTLPLLDTAGFAFLPFMWAVNALWFFHEAFWASPYPEQKQIRRCEC